MFSQLFDLEYKRDGKEAFGFYLAYFLLLLLSSGLIGAVFATVSYTHLTLPTKGIV